ncbi:hypothetical protein [Clostridium sp. ZS2-4]|uniref:hypothetical protein n=1 Tax=Clostridium sp. ZS2-4 TaxID=2987703 RepID=UPI00227C2420|nr:hypothetical protein [Clostridium sp. ZS2-4]MCY6353758.1 hypothetical protein [Clostridium sp. ZS2-4]
MNNKNLKNNSSYIFDGWKIIEKEFNVKYNFLEEVVFYLGNGYIGIKGGFEEGDYEQKGTYIKGIYDVQSNVDSEEACAYFGQNENIFNVINEKIIRIYIEDEEFNMLKGTIFEYNRTLDLKEGILHRHLIWQSPKGKRVEINTKRMVSFENIHLATISYQVIPLNFSGKIKIISSIDGDITNSVEEKKLKSASTLKKKSLNVLKKEVIKSFGAITSETTTTKFVVVCGMENQLLCEGESEVAAKEYDKKIEVVYTMDGKVNKKIEFNKYISYFTSKDCPKEKLLIKAKDMVQKSKKTGLSTIEASQKEFLQEFWGKFDVDIKHDTFINQKIRFNEFSLLQRNGKAYTLLK